MGGPIWSCIFLENPGLIYYDKIYFYTPNKHQDKLKDPERLMKGVSQKVEYEVLEFPEEIMDTSDYPQNNRKVVVFDDLVNAPSAVQNNVDQCCGRS